MQMARTLTRSAKPDADTNDFVAGGYERAIHGIEAEVRPIIEQNYADEWTASGIVKRWFLLRRMEREIAELVAERSRHISPNSLF
ncbi:hypothetical protein TBK1r_68830 [Stieleria magnilauensis]|uniref:Uncharacterized protein n=2 Tax=Stieleria magnilauensis TaxID=2527963 RepID=A0ABX5Y1G2_9BACT|nr:hypothetical protein TBK1r_68830 [Planctomycetes bacterium TBK1r]